MAEAEADPRGAEHGRSDRNGRRRPRLREGVQHKREHERREEAAEHPDEASRARPGKRECHAEIRRGRERPQRPGHRHELVDRDQRGHENDRVQPPAAEPHHAENERQADGAHEQTGDESAHRPPNLRRRCA